MNRAALAFRMGLGGGRYPTSAPDPMEAVMAQPVGTYLNDHLAGSTAAIDLLRHLEGTADAGGRGPFFAALRADIEADRAELVALIDRLGAAEGGVRQAVAWVAEKLARLKLRVESGGGPLHLLEAVEAVAIGVHGKGALWRALAATAEGVPALRGPDYSRLINRADEQRQRIEAVRLEAARAAFGG